MAIQSVNPANGKVIREFAEFNDQQIEQAIQRADDAYHAHRLDDFASRAAKLKRAAEILEDKSEDFAKTMTMEMGKPIKAARSEVQKCADLCRYYADNGAGFLANEKRDGAASRAYVSYHPIGTVLAVMPWNFPFWQVFRFAVPALMAGNTGLLKHASNVPQCAVAIENIFKEAGFSSGQFQSLLISSSKVEKILTDRRIAAATLTGSEKAGSSVAATSGLHIKKTVLELGGSDPFIVMPSADLEAALDNAVKGRIINNGQTCIAAKRFIVHDDIYEDFKRGFVQRFEALKIGDPMDENTDVGPLAMPQIRSDLDHQVRKSNEMGAEILTGCEMMDGAGNYYRPGILADIPAGAPAAHDELFGPVASLFRVQSLPQAIALGNDTRFGLGASIHSRDEDEIRVGVRDLEAGVVAVNSIVASDPALPFGGVKASGYGRELSREGIREFVNVKTVTMAG